MNHPATRDPFGSRSPGCCYHTWTPQYCTPCRICQRPVLSLQPCVLRHAAPLFPHPSVREPEHRPEFHPEPQQEQRRPEQHQQEYYHEHHHREYHWDRAYERPRRQRSFEAPSRRRGDVDVADGRPASNPYYYTHPPPGSSSGYSLQRSASVMPLGSPGGSLGQRSPGARVPKPSSIPDQPHQWIGEETKRSLPLHVYKYYLAQMKEYRRQNIKVILSRARARTTRVNDRPTHAGKRLINLDSPVACILSTPEIVLLNYLNKY